MDFGIIITTPKSFSKIKSHSTIKSTVNIFAIHIPYFNPQFSLQQFQFPIPKKWWITNTDQKGFYFLKWQKKWQPCGTMFTKRCQNITHVVVLQIRYSTCQIKRRPVWLYKGHCFRLGIRSTGFGKWEFGKRDFGKPIREFFFGKFVR